MKQETSEKYSTQFIQLTTVTNEKLSSLRTDLFQDLKLQCPFFEPAYEYCCQQNCKENAVICVKEECQCKTSHLNCSYFSKANNFNQKINNKIINYSSNDYLQIEQNTNKIVDKVSQMFDQINSSLKTFGLNQNEETVKDTIIAHFDKTNLSESKNELTGENLFKFRAEQKQADKKWFQYSIQKYRNIVKQTKKAIQPLFEQIQTTLTYMHSLHSQQKSLINYLNNSAILKHNPGVICSDYQRFVGIINKNLQVFSMKKIYSFTKQNGIFQVQQSGKVKKQGLMPLPKQQRDRLNKQQDFQLKKFQKAVKGKSNLIFLMTNTNAIRYGFYTPCMIDQTNQWKQDVNKSSFLFRLDSDYSQKLYASQLGLKFSPQKIQIGNFKNAQNGSKSNGILMTLENGLFFYEMTFAENPNPNQQQNFGLLSNNYHNYYSNESFVVTMEVYQLQVAKHTPQKLQVKTQNFNNIFGQPPVQARKFKRITVDN